MGAHGKAVDAQGKAAKVDVLSPPPNQPPVARHCQHKVRARRDRPDLQAKGAVSRQREDGARTVKGRGWTVQGRKDARAQGRCKAVIGQRPGGERRRPDLWHPDARPRRQPDRDEADLLRDLLSRPAVTPRTPVPPCPPSVPALRSSLPACHGSSTL